MKRFLVIGALAALVTWMIAGTPMMVSADRTFDTTVDKLKDPAQGYSTVVCSVWDNSSYPDGEYTDLANVSGYWYHLIQVKADACNAAQAVAIRFWASSTDSTSIYDGTIEVDLASGEGGVRSFPVRCYKVTLTGVAATDDVTMIGYARDH